MIRRKACKALLMTPRQADGCKSIGRTMIRAAAITFRLAHNTITVMICVGTLHSMLHSSHMFGVVGGAGCGCGNRAG